jgi:hypothetical protein
LHWTGPDCLLATLYFNEPTSYLVAKERAAPNYEILLILINVISSKMQVFFGPEKVAEVQKAGVGLY